MTTQEVKIDLQNGEQFGNDVSNWYTLNNPENKLRMIVINDENKFYKTIESYAKRVSQLIRRGH